MTDEIVDTFADEPDHHPHHPGTPSPEEQIKSALERSSEINRKLHLVFLLVLLYVVLTVTATSDVQLFIPDSRIQLPIIDLPLNLVRFYYIVPFYHLGFSLQCDGQSGFPLPKAQSLYRHRRRPCRHAPLFI